MQKVNTLGKSSMTSPVLTAIRILQQTLRDGKSLSDANLTPFTRQIVYGTLRCYERLVNIVSQLMPKPLAAKDQDIHLLLITGCYQLGFLHQPDYAVVNESVHVAENLGKAWAKSLVNAVLRSFLRQSNKCIAQAEKDFSARFSHPVWLMDKIRDAYPDDWQHTLLMNNTQPPFTLRVNRLKATRDEYLPASLHPYTTCGITPPIAQKTSELKGYAEGRVSVQDGGAQLAAGLLDLQPNQRVLDACAAPGNKTAHLLETEPTIQLTAIDHDAERLALVAAQLQRLQLPTINLVAMDAMNIVECTKNGLFDRILLDAPCSATGVIRRHPDVKYTRRLSDITQLHQKQILLLNALWSALTRGGKLLYVTCSILPEENTDVIAKFLATHADAREIAIRAVWGMPQTHGRQILPGDQGMDGFYYALLIKD